MVDLWKSLVEQKIISDKDEDVRYVDFSFDVASVIFTIAAILHVQTINTLVTCFILT